MTQCPKCGAEVQSHWKLCPACMSELPSVVTSPTDAQQPPAPATAYAAAEVPDITPWGLVSSPTPDPAQKAAPPAGKPPEKHDMEEILDNPMLLGVVGALVIFLVLGLALGLLIPGGLSSLFGGNSVNASSLTLITPGITPSPVAVNTAIPQTTSNSVASTSPATSTPGGNTVPTTEPTMDTSSNYVVPAGPVSNGDGSVYSPVTVTTTRTIVTTAPGDGQTAPTIPAEILAQLQNTATSTTVPTGQVIVNAAPIESGHSTGSTSWAGSGNYASDLFDLPAGVAKLSVTADQYASGWVKDSTGNIIGITSAGPQPGSNSFTVPAAGRYLVDVIGQGPWTATISMVSIKTPTQTRPTAQTPTVRTKTPTTTPTTPMTTVSPVTTHTMVPQVPTQTVTTVQQPIIPVTMQTTVPVPVPV